MSNVVVSIDKKIVAVSNTTVNVVVVVQQAWQAIPLWDAL